MAPHLVHPQANNQQEFLCDLSQNRTIFGDLTFDRTHPNAFFNNFTTKIALLFRNAIFNYLLVQYLSGSIFVNILGKGPFVYDNPIWMTNISFKEYGWSHPWFQNQPTTYIHTSDFTIATITAKSLWSKRLIIFEYKLWIFIVVKLTWKRLLDKSAIKFSFFNLWVENENLTCYYLHINWALSDREIIFQEKIIS